LQGAISIVLGLSNCVKATICLTCKLIWPYICADKEYFLSVLVLVHAVGLPFFADVFGSILSVKMQAALRMYFDPRKGGSMKAVSFLLAFFLVFFALMPSAFSTGPAFSGIVATADSAETTVANPAGMTRLKQGSVYGNPLILYTKSKTEASVEGTGQKKTSSDDSWIFLPGFYYATPVGDRWAIGVGPYAALGIGVSYDDDWAGRYILQEWSLGFVGVAPSVAYRVNSKLSLGVSIPIMYSQYSLEKAVNNLDAGAPDGKFKFDADGFGVGINIGVLYELSAHTRFGFVYRSKVSVTNEGDPEFSNLTPRRKQLLDTYGVLNKEISFDTSIPQSVLVGMFHDFQNRWSFSLDALWMDFSNWGIENVEIGDTEITRQDGNYKDMWGLALGVNYELTPLWTIRSGAFYVSSVLDKKDRTAFMRLDEMWGVGFGFEYKYREKRSVGFDLTYIQLGDGKFTAEDVPGVGNIRGEYTKNYAVMFGISTKW